MGNSLQDQLLQAGLTNKTKVNKAKKQNTKKARQQRNSKDHRPVESAQQLQQKAEKIARDRELEQQRKEVRKQREIAAQIKQLVLNNRHPKSNKENDVPFHFDNKGKIKHLYVSEHSHKLISTNKLIIVNFNGVFELVPPEIAEKIRQRNPSLVIDLPKDEKSEDGDPYADFQVPDDLMW